ncbi:histone-like nucleoid-structuring protein Lsr2 [Actinomadura harenae]|uniref:Lsr2 family protein n=1 Tax=Actinomadura harenae TaxID=2483351 RepID=A0A3M2M5C3_9ACTN|nr:Lsr2 family protein [Actinomadura harenae]RMI43675.1 Lsr2 family protein [Actinomadura harenae]
MAEKVILVDDLDGGEGEDVRKRDFEILGRIFTIDLSDENDVRLRETLDTLTRYVEKSREVKQAGRSRKPRKSPVKLKGFTNADVRTWAKNEDLEVPDQGALPDAVYEAFVQAHPEASPDA